MKKLFSTIMVVLVATVASYAQTIAVVSSSGSTTMYQDFGKAVNEAKDGSTIYLPGGGFQLNDTIRIKHKVTIMGVSHRADTDNAEGATTIAGNVWFNQGSDGSALMGVYVSGKVVIGEDGSVDNILVRYCNAHHIDVKNNVCSGLVFNQNYLRDDNYFGGSNAKVTNCIAKCIRDINGGVVNNCVVTATGSYDSYPVRSAALISVSNSVISNSIFISPGGSGFGRCNECMISNNMFPDGYTFGDDCINIADWAEVFEGPLNGVSITSKFKFKDGYSKYSDIGIYGGTGFDDEALAPIPRIISKEISEQTDADGKLNIKITVKAK